MTPARTRQKHAFTLIELLVVVAVIAILISVLLPALASVRDAAQKAQSSSNLKNLAVFFEAYSTDDERGNYPHLVPYTHNEANANPLPSMLFTGGSQVGGPIAGYQQASYGGFAGYFNLRQNLPFDESGAAPPDGNNGDPREGVFDEGFYTTWRGISEGWGEPETERTWSDETTTPFSPPVMAAYMPDPKDYQVLQSPADDLDGSPESTPAGWRTNAIEVTDINGQEDVRWNTISYLYVAGLRNNEGRIGFMADESNLNDVGGGLGMSDDGTLRQGNLPDRSQVGYLPEDNHGTEGGHVAFTDTSVEFITGQQGVHDEIFGFVPPGESVGDRRPGISSGGGINRRSITYIPNRGEAGVTAPRSTLTQSID